MNQNKHVGAGLASAHTKGITLIALVITIVIMLILASVTIGAINGGLFDYAGRAKKDTEIVGEKDSLREAFIIAKGDSKTGKIDIERIQNVLDKIVGEDKTQVTLEDNGYLVEFSDSGRTYYMDSSGSIRSIEWWNGTDAQGKSIITNGNISFAIGDYINYDATNEGTITDTYTSPESKNGVSDQIFDVGDYDGGWRVLGIKHTTNGDEIILISAQPILNSEGEGFSLNYLGYKYAVAELNNICNIYGNGDGAESAQSITVQNIDKITGYNPLKTAAGEAYRKGELGEYLNKVSIHMVTGSPRYYTSEASNRMLGNRKLPYCLL